MEGIEHAFEKPGRPARHETGARRGDSTPPRRVSPHLEVDIVGRTGQLEQARAAARRGAAARRTEVRPDLAQQAATQLARARTGLVEAGLATSAPERYVAAHLAALRAAAAVLAARTRPTARRGAPPSVWTVLATVAPELQEWAAFFAASANRRADVEAGIPGVVGPREADDLLRDAETFLALVETTLGLPAHESTLPRGHAALRAG